MDLEMDRNLRTRHSRWGRVLASVFLLLALPDPSWAQPGGSGTTELQPPITLGTLRIRSEPSGAIVTLSGAFRWKGTTPWDLNRGLVGPYRVIAQLEGYERWERTVQLVDGETRQIDIRLVPKTTWKAGMRSLLVPSWGQFYLERNRKGALLLAGALAAGGALLWSDGEYDDRVDDYRVAYDRYLSALSAGPADDIDGRREAAERSRRRADHAYDRRKEFVYLAWGIYLISFVDAVFLSSAPSEGSFASYSPLGDRGPDLALEGSARGDLRLALRWSRSEGAER